MISLKRSAPEADPMTWEKARVAMRPRERNNGEETMVTVKEGELILQCSCRRKECARESVSESFLTPPGCSAIGDIRNPVERKRAKWNSD